MADRGDIFFSESVLSITNPPNQVEVNKILGVKR